MNEGNGRGPETPAGPKGTIIIADDEPHVRVYLKSVISRLHCEVVGEAANGEEAIRLFREKRPDLLLMDLNMPIKTGDAALKEIVETFPDAKVVILSSLADRASVETCIMNGAVGYLRKDTSFEEITKVVREALSDET